MFRAFASLLAVDVGDTVFARAQFREFCKQLPLLYMILVCNALAIAVDFYSQDHLAETVLVPAVICGLSIMRAFWWLQRADDDLFSDAEIAKHIRRTCNVAVIFAITFNVWGMWIYELGDAYERGHLTFFLALTQVSSVFCLMTMRAAALRVVLSSTLLFISFFLWVDDGRMAAETIVLYFVSIGMVAVVRRHNIDFYDLIRSQSDLRSRKVEAEQLSEENRKIALTDPLSGLPNRRQMLARLDELDAHADLQPDTLAVMFIDLDGFKDINDTHGHQAGDALIVALAKRLSKFCPPFAMLARVGGDEFAILLEGSGAIAKARSLARRFEEQIGLPLRVDRQVLQVGASIGIAGNDEAGLQAHEILRRADTAMYHVKLSGKGGVASYSQSFDEGRLHRLAIEQEIGRGLANDEFEVVYQPVVDAQTGSFVGAEALVRWPRRPGGELDPQQFIDIAEATGQIHPLGLFVFERACRDFLGLADLKLSVNVSPSQFQDPQFERNVLDTVEDCGIPAERLQLEITEGYLLARPDRAIAVIAAFKEEGMSVALDDFGSGFTSIHYLRTYGFSHIKIDKSLLKGLRADNKVATLLRGTIYLADGLDMQVIAEGVETQLQAQILREAGCHMMQGYYFGKPMPIGQFVRAYRTNRRNIPRVVELRQRA